MATDNEIIRSRAGFIATALSEATGDRWTVDPDTDSGFNAKLKGPDGQGIYLDFGYLAKADAKIEITGDYDWQPDMPRHENISIGVTGSRPPGKIAAEIVRRFLPRYVAELATVRERVAATTRADTERIALGEKLAALAGAMVRNHGGRPRFDLGRAEISVESGHSVSFDIRSVDPDLARAIIELLAARN